MNKLVQIFAVLGLGLVAIFLQGSLLRIFLPDFLAPNLIISIVVFLAFYNNSPFGALLTFILGIELDLYGGNPSLIGPSAGALVLAFGIIASVSQRVYLESSFAIGVMAWVSSLVYTVIYSILIFEFNDAAARYFSFSISNSFVTGLLTPLIFKLINKTRRGKKVSRGAHSHGTGNRSGRQRQSAHKAGR
jgi:rod shape-determining protein MreD